MSVKSAIDLIDHPIGQILAQKAQLLQGYFRLLQHIVQAKGIPLALYHDRHCIFELAAAKSPSLEEQLEGKRPLTQFGRLLQELGITSIAALSPQAKGRIERLWGTFQDRLVSELRLARASTIAEANRVLGDFLSCYNQKFAVPAAAPGSAYRQVGDGFVANEVFCFKYQRTVGADNVVRFEGHRLQIVPTNGRASYARCRVEVHQGLDGTLKVYYQGHSLSTIPAPLEPARLREPILTRSLAPRRYAKPAPDHPWRHWVYRANKEQG